MVEDEASIREMIALNLRLAGMEAVEAEDVYKRQVAFYRERGKLAVIPFCPSIEETTAEVMKALEA